MKKNQSVEDLLAQFELTQEQEMVLGEAIPEELKDEFTPEIKEIKEDTEIELWHQYFCPVGEEIDPNESEPSFEKRIEAAHELLEHYEGNEKTYKKALGLLGNAYKTLGLQLLHDGIFMIGGKESQNLFRKAQSKLDKAIDKFNETIDLNKNDKDGQKNNQSLIRVVKSLEIARELAPKINYVNRILIGFSSEAEDYPLAFTQLDSHLKDVKAESDKSLKDPALSIKIYVEGRNGKYEEMTSIPYVWKKDLFLPWTIRETLENIGLPVEVDTTTHKFGYVKGFPRQWQSIEDTIIYKGISFGEQKNTPNMSFNKRFLGVLSKTIESAAELFKDYENWLRKIRSADIPEEEKSFIFDKYYEALEEGVIKNIDETFQELTSYKRPKVMITSLRR